MSSTTPIKTNPSQLKTGNYLSRTSYMKIVSTGSMDIQVQNENGITWRISNDIIQAECHDPHYHSKEEQLTRTELIARFLDVGDHAFTVNFNKQPKVEDAYEEIANKGKLKSNAEIKKALKEKMKGEERTLIGYVISRDINLGRTMVVDLEVSNSEDRIRLVDHRTLNWFISKGVKYSVKSK